MNDLLEIQDELHAVRNYVECAFQACDADGIMAVLDAASDKLTAIDEAIDALKGDEPMKHLGSIIDDVDLAGDFVEAAFMACADLRGQ